MPKFYLVYSLNRLHQADSVIELRSVPRPLIGPPSLSPSLPPSLPLFLETWKLGYLETQKLGGIFFLETRNKRKKEERKKQKKGKKERTTNLRRKQIKDK